MVIVSASSDAVGLPDWALLCLSPPPPPQSSCTLHSSHSLSYFHQNLLDSHCFNLMQEPGLRPSSPAPSSAVSMLGPVMNASGAGG